MNAPISKFQEIHLRQLLSQGVAGMQHSKTGML